MFRTLFALLALAGFAATAGAQPGNRGLPLAPGVHAGSPFGPGQPLYANSPHFTHPHIAHPSVGRAIGFGYPVFGTYRYGFGGYGYSYGYGGFGYPFGGYGYSPYFNAAPILQPVVVGRAWRSAPTLAVANEFPATLTLQFPARAELWLNGDEVKDVTSDEHVLTSPVLKPGEQFTFDVKARWKVDGREYESTRAVTLGSGDRSRLFIVSGTEVK